MSYPGAKNAAGVWQTIINNIPPHDLWIEAFAGSAAISRMKKPALIRSVAIEADKRVCVRLRGQLSTLGIQMEVCEADAVTWLEANRPLFNARTVVYCDPPYLFETRNDQTRRYWGGKLDGVEFGEIWMHKALLSVLVWLKEHGVSCLVSGRAHSLYDEFLIGWRRVDYQTSTHGGAVTESLWCSFPEPVELHDLRWLGKNFRERERIKRKLARWKARLHKMPILERRLIAAAMTEI